MDWGILGRTSTHTLVFLAVSFGFLGLASAGPLDDRLAELGAAAPGEARLTAAKAVAALGPEAAPAMIERLHKVRASSDAERRALLTGIGADVPNAAGSFTYPGRPKNPNPDELDWLAALAKLPASPQVGDALEVVTLLRALGDTRLEIAADAILDYGFTPDGLVYRDETGRQIRRMSPACLPTLLRASTDKKRDAGSFARYANYQLDRLSMNRPEYALRAATDDGLEVAMLAAIRDVKHPDAVTAVLDRVDSPSNAVRRAAREAWMAYVTGPPPPPAPRSFRKLPGGKLSRESLPLYLTYRELADQELRRVLLAQQGTEPAKSLGALDMTKVLFELYDRRRAEKGDEIVQTTVAAASAGQWEEVGKKYDALLMADPLYARRSQLAPGYLELARLLARKGDWQGAVVAYHKTLAVDPEGPLVKEARAELAGALIERDGIGAAAPTSPTIGQPTGAAPPPGHPGARRGWLLPAGIVTAVGGALLLALGLLRRRRQPQVA